MHARVTLVEVAEKNIGNGQNTVKIHGRWWRSGDRNALAPIGLTN